MIVVGGGLGMSNKYPWQQSPLDEWSIVGMIKDYPPGLEEKIPAIREQWKKIGLNTETIDREQARIAVNGLYEAHNYPPPNIFFLDSPIALLLARRFLIRAAKMHAQMSAQMYAQVIEKFNKTSDKHGQKLSLSNAL